MASNNIPAVLSGNTDPDLQKFSHEGSSFKSEEDRELQTALEVLSKVDVALTYLPEKLGNLENLLTLVLSTKSDVDAADAEYDNISSDFIEKAFAFHLLYAILIFELRELDNLISGLQDGLLSISSYDHSSELLTGLQDKLHSSVDGLKQWEDHVLKMNIQLAKLQMTSFLFKQNEYKLNLDMGVKEEPRLGTLEWKSEIPTVERRRILRMLEISLAREMELEKMLSELSQNEEDLKLKTRLTEQVSAGMEEVAEVAWGRFLEADNTAEVWMGISKELLEKFQITRLHGYGSATGKAVEVQSKLEDSLNLLKEKETSIQELNSRIAQLVLDNAEFIGLRGRVQMLEEKLGETESKVMEAKSASETSQKQRRAKEDEVESLRENLSSVERRAENAEEKVTQLTELNHELTEELDFLKGSNNSIAKKASLLEKQVTEFDIQLQHARASSEAGQEQQNMLYSAIFDMETLIDELKQKVSKAESKAESIEGRCIMLSETNSELRKEVGFLRSRVEFTENSLDQATIQKGSSAKVISLSSTIIMDMVLQLTMERERIQKQLASLTIENKLLRERLQKELKIATILLQNKMNHEDKAESLPHKLGSADAKLVKAFSMKSTEISSEISEVEKTPTESDSLEVNGEGSSGSARDITSLGITSLGIKKEAESNKSGKGYKFIAIVVLLLSILAAHLLLAMDEHVERTESLDSF